MTLEFPSKSVILLFCLALPPLPFHFHSNSKRQIKESARGFLSSFMVSGDLNPHLPYPSAILFPLHYSGSSNFFPCRLVEWKTENRELQENIYYSIYNMTICAAKCCPITASTMISVNKQILKWHNLLQVLYSHSKETKPCGTALKSLTAWENGEIPPPNISC